MKDENKTKKQLINEVKDLQKRIAELEASEIKFRTLFEHASGAIFIADTKTGKILDCNKQAEKLIGRKRDKITGMHQTELHPQGEEDKYKKKFAHHVKTGQLVDYEGEVQHRDGRRIPVLMNANTMKISNKKLIVGAFLDITEKKKGEREIEENRDFLESIFRTSVDGLMVGDSEGYITMINKAMEKMIGYSKDELIGKHPIELGKKDKEHKTSGKQIVQEMLKIDVMTGLERTWIKKDGSLIDVEINLAFLKDDKGNVTGSVAGIRDITERKKVEAELKKSEEKYHNLIEHANDAIVSMNQRGKIIEFNKKAEEFFGYNREEILGKPIYLLAPQQYIEGQKNILKEFKKTGGILGLDGRISEGGGLKKNGQVFPLEISFYVLKVHGEPIATSTIRDITKRKEAEKKVLEYQKKLKTLTSQITMNEEKERKRLANFLHDQIGQELFAIKIKLELLKDALSSHEDIRVLSDLSNSIIRTMDNTRSLTFDLSPPILYQLGLEAALEWLAEQIYVQHNIMVSLEDDKQEKPLDEDVKIFLYRAVHELLINVAKHAQTQNAKVSIEKDNTNIRICVEDNGVGFIPSSKYPSKDKNNGFGLFSIKERLNQLDGHLEIKSRDGRGTQASLTAPLKNKRKR